MAGRADGRGNFDGFTSHTSGYRSFAGPLGAGYAGAGIGRFLAVASRSIGNINTLFSLFHQEKKEIREAVQPWGIRNLTDFRRRAQ